MAALVFDTRATGTRLVASNPGNGYRRPRWNRIHSDLTFPLPEPSLADLKASLSRIECGIPLPETILELGQEQGLCVRVHDDRAELVLDQGSDSSSH